MVKPGYLWALCKTCTDSTWIGAICRKLGGQDIALDYGQQQAYNAIMMDSEWMDERIKERKEKDAEKHREWRAKRDKARRKQLVNQVVTDFAHLVTASPSVTGDAGDLVTSPNVTSHPSVHPSVRPSVRPSIQTGNTDRSDAETDTDPDAREGHRGGRGGTSDSVSDSASDSVDISSLIRESRAEKERPNPWRWEDDEVRYTTDWDTRTILSFALGKGSWAKAVKQAGDTAVRELFLQFRAEINCGEIPQNPAAAFTKRLARDLGVDFRKD